MSNQQEKTQDEERKGLNPLSNDPDFGKPTIKIKEPKNG